MSPQDQITKYLFANKSKVESLSLEQVVRQVRLSVFFSMPPIPDDEIKTVVSRWAMIHAVGMLVKLPPGSTAPGPIPPASPTPESELVSTVKKAITMVSEGVTLGPKGANLNLGVTGLTANLKQGEQALRLGVSWTGTLKLETESGPFHFSASLSPDKWELSLSFPQDTYIPDLSKLAKVFQEGERAVGQMAAATRSFSKVSDAGKVGAMIKPHAAAIQDAADAVSGLANASRKGGPSFGFKMGSPQPGPGEKGMPGGVEGYVVFTYVF